LIYEEGLDNEERTLRLDAVLEHAHPTSRITPTVDNTDTNLDKGDARVTDKANEETVQGGCETGLDRTQEYCILQRIKEKMKDGDMSKARAAISPTGSFNYTTTTGSDKLRSKYPTNEQRRASGAAYRGSAEHEEHKTAITHGSVANENSLEALTAHINKKKKGASHSTTGQSNDHYQSIIRNHPKAAEYIVIICDWIASGGVVDGVTLDKLMRGKGSALNKKNKSDVDLSQADSLYLTTPGTY
jgi:hypothetical protein